MVVGVALKWQARRALVDPITGALRSEELHGPSEADLAALEHALRLAESWSGEVLAVCAGPVEAQSMLREALAAGAARALRISGAGADASPPHVARALAGAFTGADLVVCGVHGLDQGSGAVPALLAAELGAAQALGLVSVEPGSSPQDGLIATRRLSGGWRERLRVHAPAVLSVEGASATLRRAPLTAMIAAGRATIESAPARVSVSDGAPEPARERLPDRPRPRIVDPPEPDLPAHERILALTGVGGDGAGARVLVEDQEPAEAARRVLDALRRWNALS
ncbi:MAG TPA: mycofactocin-associated electron transfer flavoprotein beta subunit [Solirubrobacteraceae bacterium]|jgi:electron transfer flavoprotein beta subunit|nr:mycofactocin-associated electron transfer flavoprotein beta subunit [Solirubrobacteraceae bacterium]